MRRRGLGGCGRLSAALRRGAALVEHLLEELLRGIGPDVAVGLAVDQRLLDGAGLRAGDVLDAAADAAEQRLAEVWVRVQRGGQRGARLVLGARHEVRQRQAQLRAAAGGLRFHRRLQHRGGVGRLLQLHQRLGGDEPRLGPDGALVDRVHLLEIGHGVGEAILIVREATDRVAGADVRLHLGRA